MFSLGQFVVWLIIGLLGGSLAGLIIKRERKGFGILRNLGLGLAGLSSAVSCFACSGCSAGSTT